MEWQLDCFDILKRPIVCEIPALIRHEEMIKAGQTTVATSAESLPLRTKSFMPKLKAILYEDGQIVEYLQDVQICAVEPRKSIEDLEDFNPEFLDIFMEEHALSHNPKFFYQTHGQGLWTCAFCGTINAQDVSECRQCGTGVAHQSVCSVAAISSSFAKWKKHHEEALRQQSELAQERRRKEEQEELERLATLEIEYGKKRQQSLQRALEEQQHKKSLKRKRKIWLIGIVCLIAIGIALWFLVFQDMLAYYQADKSMRSGAYYDAQGEFSALEDYRDARQRSVDAYAMAIGQLRLQDQLEGLMWVEAQGNTKAKEYVYTIAQELEAEGIYLAASQGFSSLGAYRDSEDKFLGVYRKYVQQQPSMEFRLEGYQWLLEQRYPQDALYAIALTFFEKDDADAAYPIFKALGNHKDARSYMFKLAKTLQLQSEL